MDRYEPEKVGDVLRQALQQKGMTDRLYETRAVAVWPEVVGETLAGQCGKPYVNDGVMTVFVRSASLRQELNMSRSALVRIINDRLGRETLKDIRFR